jgi:hypothetical protein
MQQAGRRAWVLRATMERFAVFCGLFAVGSAAAVSLAALASGVAPPGLPGWWPEFGGTALVLGLLAHLSARHRWSAAENGARLRLPTRTVLATGPRPADRAAGPATR